MQLSGKIGWRRCAMRFIATFLVVAVAALSLTWYFGYDYNMYEYRLIKSIVVKVHDYMYEDADESADDRDAHGTECHSWSTLNDLMEKLFRRIIDTYGTVYKHPSHKLSENLTDDVSDISMVIDNFHGRLTVAMHSLPDDLYPVRIIFESMQTNLDDINKQLAELSKELLQKIDDDYSDSRKSLMLQFAKMLLRLGYIIRTRKDSALGCVCAASLKLDTVSVAAIDNVNYCIDDAENHYRDIFNTTKLGLNINLEHTVDVLTESNTGSVSMFDNFFQLPVHVSISNMFSH